MQKKLILFLVSLALILSCSQTQRNSGIDKNNFDLSVKPQDDFYRYANGTWLKNAEIPADRSSWGAFYVLREEAQKNLRAIIEESANMNDKKPGSDEQKVGDFYLSFMDSAHIEELGLSPLQQEFKIIDQVASKADLVQLMAHNLKVGQAVPFYYFISPDKKKSDEYISYLYQSGLGLPDRDYYLKQEKKYQDIRAKYIEYIQNIFNLAGIKEGPRKAAAILDIEMKIAKAHWTRVDNRDRDKTYNKFSLNDLSRKTANFDWINLFKSAGIQGVDQVVVYQPSFFKTFGNIFKQTSVQNWKDYFSYKLLSGSAPLLNHKFVDLNFDFFSKTLRGVEQIRPRWKRGVRNVEGSLGEVVGKVYVKKHFKPEAKQRMVQLVKNLQKSFAKRIEQLDWMSPETKKEALVKLSKFNAKIGYPDKWKDYSKLTVDKNDLIGNVARSNQVEFQREIAKLGQPIDKDEWGMTPQTVNAYYNASMNEVVFPAAILQPPFFNMQADDAVNYGSIGYVIGHEMTHGFDDQGRKSDGDGNLRDWWTAADNENFMKRAQVMIDQYDSFSPLDSMHVNGKLTLGENIADLGGMVISYYAYHMSLNGQEAPIIDGLTGDQRFFLGLAQLSQSVIRDEALRQRLLTDPHSPGEYRCNGVVSNMPEFYKAFAVQPGQPMYRDEKVRVNIW